MKKTLCLILTLIFSSVNISSAAIIDTFVEQTLNKDLKITPQEMPFYDDFLITPEFVKKYKNQSYKNTVFIVDTVANEDLKKYKHQKLISYVPVDFNNLQKTTFKLKPNISISTGNKRLKEGSKIEFILAEDFWYKKQFFPKGTKVNAQVEIILPNSKMGFPSTLEIGNFQINNEKIDANLTKDGANRTIWLAPTIYITSLFFFVGLLLIPIKGGHAKLYKNKIYTVNANIIE